jgi:Protein of unknown function (DUF3732)
MASHRGNSCYDHGELGSCALSFQIAKLILYSTKGQVRELPFRIGALNILTGASKTGKSAIIDIIDYCTGRSECYVADGVIRKHVAWYAVLFALGGGQILVARKNPGPGEKTSPDIYLERGNNIALPVLDALHKNITVEALEKFLAAALGISENEHRPPEGQTRAPLEANFRHALIFSIQDQDDIDSKKVLFHRQADNWVAQAIKDTFPYFLGAIDEDHLLKQAQLDAARRQLRQLERQLRDAQSIDSNEFPRARALFDEAKQFGLVNERLVPTTYEILMGALREAARDDYVRDEMIVADGEDILANLRNERHQLRVELERVKAEIRSTRLFSSESGGYEREAREQHARLSAVGLIQNGAHDGRRCPLCESALQTPVPAVAQVARSLREVSDQLQAVEMENPRLQTRLIALQREEELLGTKLRENQQRMNERLRENEILRVQQDNFILQARIIGKIAQYLDTAANTQDDSALNKSVETARSRVAILEQDLNAEDAQEKVDTYLNIIGRYMSSYSDELDLEHRGNQLRLDIRNLTVVADTLDGPVPLYRMGSGENWVGYHVLAHLALHKWFHQKQRPVPSFVIFDQPSQAHYPPDRDAEGSIDALKDEDKTAVLKLFKLISLAAAELAPGLQIIVMDHADLKDPWFETAVVERWRGGNKLIPSDWIST